MLILSEIWCNTTDAGKRTFDTSWAASYLITNQLIIWRVSIFEVGHLCNRFCSSFPDYLELACIFSFERHLSTKNYSTRERKRKLIIIWWRSQQHLHLVIFSISPNHHLMLCYVMLCYTSWHCTVWIFPSGNLSGGFYPFWFKSFGLWWIICCIWFTFDPSLFCGLTRRRSLWWSTRWPTLYLWAGASILYWVVSWWTIPPNALNAIVFAKQSNREKYRFTNDISAWFLDACLISSQEFRIH